MEHPWTVFLVVTFLLCSAGCLDTLSGEPQTPAATPVPTTVITTVQPTWVPPEQSSDMALQPSDLPSDYVLQDRTVMALHDVSQIARELGWRQGYYVSYYRRNANNNEITRIRQSVSIFRSEDINGIYLLAKEDLKEQKLTPGSRYEIPFPQVGDRSIAFRETSPFDTEHPVTYTVIFTKKNVFEKITMSGTNTDYETLKRLVLRAEALIA
ncbi:MULTISPECIES: hypothetical protein [unclassified Methanoregula]|uniref:hypothetical protein n=1 Tax=unclassified Methanoregula TaxID=2649730 RepID=UPI0025F90E5B|nr:MULTISPECIES: hypothetical protein [unclassified Methanoregula]